MINGKHFFFFFFISLTHSFPSFERQRINGMCLKFISAFWGVTEILKVDVTGLMFDVKNVKAITLTIWVDSIVNFLIKRKKSNIKKFFSVSFSFQIIHNSCLWDKNCYKSISGKKFMASCTEFKLLDIKWIILPVISNAETVLTIFFSSLHWLRKMWKSP